MKKSFFNSSSNWLVFILTLLAVFISAYGVIDGSYTLSHILWVWFSYTPLALLAALGFYIGHLADKKAKEEKKL